MFFMSLHCTVAIVLYISMLMWFLVLTDNLFVVTFFLTIELFNPASRNGWDWEFYTLTTIALLSSILVNINNVEYPVGYGPARQLSNLFTIYQK